MPVGVEDMENFYSVCPDHGKYFPGLCPGVYHDAFLRFTVSQEVAVDPQLSHHNSLENHVSSPWLCFPAAGKGCAEDYQQDGKALFPHFRTDPDSRSCPVQLSVYRTGCCENLFSPGLPSSKVRFAAAQGAVACRFRQVLLLAVSLRSCPRRSSGRTAGDRKSSSPAVPLLS